MPSLGQFLFLAVLSSLFFESNTDNNTIIQFKKGTTILLEKVCNQNFVIFFTLLEVASISSFCFIRSFFEWSTHNNTFWKSNYHITWEDMQPSLARANDLQLFCVNINMSKLCPQAEPLDYRLNMCVTVYFLNSAFSVNVFFSNT